MSNIKIKEGGVWKDSPAQFLKVAGIWKPIVNVYEKIAGIWKCVTCAGIPKVLSSTILDTQADGILVQWDMDMNMSCDVKDQFTVLVDGHPGHVNSVAFHPQDRSQMAIIMNHDFHSGDTVTWAYADNGPCDLHQEGVPTNEADNQTYAVVNSIAPAPAPPVEYDAYVIGATLAGDTNLSIYHQVDGVTEEAANSGVHLLDGNSYLINPHYQTGVTDGHIADNDPIFMGKNFNDAHPEKLYNIADSVINGSFLKGWVANNKVVTIHYDQAKHRLYAEWVY